jgi:hypothetical protein
VPVVPNHLPWGLERYAFLVNGQMSSRFPFLIRNFEFVPAYHASLKLESASETMINDYPEMDLLEDMIRARFTKMECWTFRFFNREFNFSSLNISQQEVKVLPTPNLWDLLYSHILSFTNGSHII